jgi:hypothetical protein
MTAEIIVMNKHAIAMASDSAVTFPDDKIFTSANKLFMLSKYHPVGIMIYDSADFMGMPWEIIIKLFRQHLEETKYDTITGYVLH